MSIIKTVALTTSSAFAPAAAEYGQQILDALLCLLVGIVGNKGAGRRIQRELTETNTKPFASTA